MKRKFVAIPAVCTLLTLAFFSFSGQTTRSHRREAPGSGAIHGRSVPNRLLVKFKDDAKGMGAEAGRAQVEHAHNLKHLKHFGLTGVHVYRTEGPTDRTLKALEKNPNVAYAEPDYIAQIDATIPNDTYFSQLWGMHNTGQSGGTVDADIDAPEAWDLTTGNANVVVAIIDTGVAYAHPDLAANMWTNPFEIAANGVDDDGNGYIDDIHGINAITGSGDPMDDHNHGTHCAGTIAAVGNNGAGVAGVCWTAKIMALKFVTSSGTGAYSDAIECIEYAVGKGAHILSNSWGSYDYGQALEDAIDAAAAAGVLFVAAAGNDGYDNDGTLHHYPSSYESQNIIAVAATDRYDHLSVFSSGASNFGAHSVDVAAPGSTITSTIRGDTYGTMSGTSMATPHVAGLAALIKSYNFALNWMQIKARVLGGVDPLAALQGKVLTGGRINAYNSLVMNDPASYLLNVSSMPAAGAAITVNPVDLDGGSSGTTDFSRRYAPYASVTLTAPATLQDLAFGYWAFGAYRFSDAPSVTFPMDFDHTITAHYLLPLADAIDNAALEAITGGNRGGFYGQLSTSYAGGDAAQSCDIGDSESGYLQTTVHGPGDLSFYWKVSSEAGSDLLSYSVDGAQMDAISGDVDWAQVASALGPGTHVVRWTYAKNAGGSAGTDCGWVDDVQFSGAPATLAQALDLDLTAWRTGGDGGWFHQTTLYQYDGDAAQSSLLADGQQTYLQTTVSGPTPLSFYWKVSSEADWDFLHFYIDGELQDSISGEVDWSPQSYSLGSGSHTLRWIYAKDGSASGGSDRGWVDHVALNPSGSHTLTLAKGGIGTGRVRVGADPIPHGLPYQEAFAAGAEVALEAVPDAGSLFTGWSGDLISVANPAAVTMDQDKGIIANFALTQILDSITLTSPNGGEEWVVGTNRSVVWGWTGAIGNVAIDYSTDGGQTWLTAAASAPNTGIWSWAVPNSPSASCLIKVADAADKTVFDTSNAFFSISGQSSASTDWPMFRRDLESTGQVGYRVDTASIELAWQTPISTSYAHAVVKDGIVYVGRQPLSARVYAIDAATGGIIWQFMMPDRPDGDYRDMKSAVALHDGIMVVNSWDKTVYGVNVADGSLAWTFESPYALHTSARRGFFINPSPKVLDGVVYVGLGDARLHAINAESGAEIWAFPTNSAIVSSPAFWGELVFIASGRSGYDRTLYAVNKTTGQMVWNRAVSADGISSPVVNGGAVIYGNANRAYSLNASTGVENWHYDIPSGENIEGTPAISETRIYICGGNWSVSPPTASIYCLDKATGALVWEKPGYFVRESPVLAGDVVFVGECRDNTGALPSSFFALDAGTGETLWSYETDYVILGIPAVTPGRVYVACGDGYLRALSYRFAAGTRVDFNGDGQEDILWRYQGSGDYQGLNVIWLMNQGGGAAPASLAMEQSSAGEKGLSGLQSAARDELLQPAGMQPTSMGAPVIPIRSILRGGLARVPRPKLTMRAPLEVGNRSAPFRREWPQAKDFGKILIRDSASGPGIQGADNAKIASLRLGQEVVFSQIPDTAWEIAGTGDFNGDTKTDILWRYYGTGDYQGLNDIWFMDGTTFQSESVFSQIPDTNWRIAGTGDFDGDGDTDILWRYYGTGAYQGLNVIWYMNGAQFAGETVFSQVLDTDWRIEGTGDFNSDGQTDILWRYYGTGGYQGLNDIWFMNGSIFVGESVFSQIMDTAWQIGGTGDFNGDGQTDILWRYYGTIAYRGLNVIWYMTGATKDSEEVFSQVFDTNWRSLNR